MRRATANTASSSPNCPSSTSRSWLFFIWLNHPSKCCWLVPCPRLAPTPNAGRIQAGFAVPRHGGADTGGGEGRRPRALLRREARGRRPRAPRREATGVRQAGPCEVPATSAGGGAWWQPREVARELLATSAGGAAAAAQRALRPAALGGGAAGGGTRGPRKLCGRWCSVVAARGDDWPHRI